MKVASSDWISQSRFFNCTGQIARRQSCSTPGDAKARGRTFFCQTCNLREACGGEHYWACVAVANKKMLHCLVEPD